MAPSFLRKVALSFPLFAIVAQTAQLNYSGEAITTRFWDCCKPSCAWNGKAQVSSPVESCSADDKPTDMGAGTGCNGGTAYQCSKQQPWAISDSLSYGFAGVFITPDLTHGGIEDAWCCACYRLDFTSEPLIGKSMIVQASNTAYDITTTNRFTLAIPGGNNTSNNACAQQYSINQAVFGENNSGVSTIDDCNKLPNALQDGCRWRFNWFKDASFPSAKFQRVVCPAEITNRTGCIRTDDKVLAGTVKASAAAATTSLAAPISTMAMFAAILLSLISI